MGILQLFTQAHLRSQESNTYTYTTASEDLPFHQSSKCRPSDRRSRELSACTTRRPTSTTMRTSTRRLLVTFTSSSRRLKPKIPSTLRADLAPSSIVSSHTATRRPKIRLLPKLPLVLKLPPLVLSSSTQLPLKSTALPLPSLHTHEYPENDHQDMNSKRSDST